MDTKYPQDGCEELISTFMRVQDKLADYRASDIPYIKKLCPPYVSETKLRECLAHGGVTEMGNLISSIVKRYREMLFEHKCEAELLRQKLGALNKELFKKHLKLKWLHFKAWFTKKTNILWSYL